MDKVTEMAESGPTLRAKSENRERLRHECVCVLCPTYTPRAAGEHEPLNCFIDRSTHCITGDL
ncbi:MAG: hypothetical protein ABFC38_01395 [Methanospirillum sp.]